jgi:hypothetical protein
MGLRNTGFLTAEGWYNYFFSEIKARPSEAGSLILVFDR